MMVSAIPLLSVFSCALTLELELIRKYGRYHRPIARPTVFWLNEWSATRPIFFRLQSTGLRETDKYEGENDDNYG